MKYAELHCVSNFSFLRGASRPEELVEQAAALGYEALAITDECSLAGVVRAFGKWRELSEAGHPLKLIIGSEFRVDPETVVSATGGSATGGSATGGSATGGSATGGSPTEAALKTTLEPGFRLLVLVQRLAGYHSLCTLISRSRRAAEKGEYLISAAELAQTDFSNCALLLVPPYNPRRPCPAVLDWFMSVAAAAGSAHLALALHFRQHDQQHLDWVTSTARQYSLPVAATGDVQMHIRQRRALQDVMTCIRHHCTLNNAGQRLFPNGERHLRSLEVLHAYYSPAALQASVDIAAGCAFSLGELSYQYPDEVVPAGLSADAHLRALTEQGIRWRWPAGIGDELRQQIDHELELITDMGYEHYFLTVHDIVSFARSRQILCQGRGSAANSAVCFCLGITEVDPARTSMLFERFISKERNEPPDIDVDFEHERREEVIQYIYDKYGRDRAALAATVITYRKRSAIRDIGKVLGLQTEQIEQLSRSLAWWDGNEVISERLLAMGFDGDSLIFRRFAWLLSQILGFPRHLSQHVGGFVIANDTLATLVPVENAAMPDRTIIQWDKDDLEELGLLKVDVLALGMLTAIRKCFELLHEFRGIRHTMSGIPPNDTPTYDMICRADTMGVFQIESRAQMSMLPRLKPRNFYDLVIEVAIVRPGPIQGGMVNPYLKRRQGLEPVTYPNNALKRVLKRTLGVPVFQEQVMEIAMVAAGFSAGEADHLRRSMAAWRRVGAVSRFRDQLIQGMLDKGYEPDFAESIFRQIEGFGEYGFPESHAASFALLVYVSCWLKCHEPAAFLCALLNSQPLGFYDPSDLTQDARRHGIRVLPVDINASDWDHQLVEDTGARVTHTNAGPQPAVRLGFRLVNKLSQCGAGKILAARTRPYTSAADLLQRTGINKADQQALAISNALAPISGNRHQAQWDLLGVESLSGLLAGTSAAEPQLDLPLPTEGENIVADYLATGLTLGRHPLALLRKQLDRRNILRSNHWPRIANGRQARLAGIVKVRQRPGSASGVVFVTLEDEDGQVNVVVWPDTVEAHRNEVLHGQMLAVFGTTQRESGVTHLIAREIEDLSWMLGELRSHSRNFH